MFFGKTMYKNMFHSFLYFIFNVLIITLAYNEIADFKQVLQEETHLLALFTEECCACTDCVEYETMLGAMSKTLEEMNLLVVKLKSTELKLKYGIKSTPAVVYIRNRIPVLYDGKLKPESIYWWLSDNGEAYTKSLNDENFEHLTQAATGATTGDWLVAFYDDTCIEKTALLTHLEGVSSHLKSRLNVAIVNRKNSEETMERFKIRNCPSVIYFRYGKMYRTEWGSSATLRRFVERLYKEHKAEAVPSPRTYFDKITEYIAHSHFFNIALAFAVFVCCMVFAFIRNAKYKAD